MKIHPYPRQTLTGAIYTLILALASGTLFLISPGQLYSVSTSLGIPAVGLLAILLIASAYRCVVVARETRETWYHGLSVACLIAGSAIAYVGLSHLLLT